MASSSLRPHAVQRPLHSPTGSSDHTTTPTSPHFSSHPNPHPALPRSHPHPYANRSADLLASTSTLASTTRSPSHRPATPPLLHAPPGVSFSSYLAGWTGEQLQQFLTQCKCGHYADTFRRNDIDGRVLLDLDMASLKEMGVTKVGERVKLLSGIKDLRKRATGQVTSNAASMVGRSVVELRLNGTATPSPDWTTGGGPGLNPTAGVGGAGGGAGGGVGISGGVGGLVVPTRPGHERSLSHTGSQSSMGERREKIDRSLSTRRPGNARPPPLDLHSSSRGHGPSLSYSHPNGNGSSTAVSAASIYDAPASALTQRGPSSTPRPSTQNGPVYPGNLQRPSISSQTSSSATITPASLNSSSTISRPQPLPSNLNLRAPPARDTARRSPSPINGIDSASFVDRPLPPAPGSSGGPTSSAAEYARQHAGTPTPPSWQSNHGKGPSPSFAERRAATGHGQPSVSALSGSNGIRKPPASSGPSFGSTQQKQPSPIKAKFSALVNRNPQPAVHPFAATRDPKEVVPPKDRERERELSTRSGDHHSGSLRNQTGGYSVGAGPLKSSSSRTAPPAPPPAAANPPRQNSISSASIGSGSVISLEEVRRQVVKFINSEDGTTRTVNVSSCTSGVEVLERVLKKFGKWNTGNVSSEGESDEEGERLEVDGWGVYTDDADHNSKPLSEAALLGICLSHRDGSALRERGLVLRRSRKFGNRKNMSEFFGEQPPAPLSPKSPTYFGGGPRLGISQTQSSDPANLLTPTRTRRATNANVNRASMVSVMSGLGVAVTDLPPSPSTVVRSPSTASFLPGSRKKMYNFFGHRPPSELISNHLAEYFPSAKKKELDKTVRKSVYRQSIYGAKRGSIAPSVMSGRESFDFAPSAKPSPPRRRPTSRMTMTSPPSSSAIPEEGEETGGSDEALARPGVPRMSVSDEAGSIRRPMIDGDTSASSGADSDRPPLLPAFEPFNESLSDSLQAYSRSVSAPSVASAIPPDKRASLARPKSISQHGRRNSASSSRSRMSTFSQMRRARDRSDTASMLTVDEITAEVENRRASTISFDETSDEEEMEPAVVGTAILAPPQDIANVGDMPVDEGDGSEEADESDDESEEDSDSDEDEDESDEEEDAGEDEHGKAYTSTGSGRIIKWIKGALIGAGSFGSVYLGMDAQSGLLMAVKQVELGSGKNVERKRGMIEALEREIELLKELQHENIVQYLDSSIDGTHLNIFLEYVPGGSIAALLNNYGAFEEALVRNFVRQILTGLNYLHEREIIHRDIKGANILVDNKGGIKISDFGISKKVESNLLQGIGASRPSLQGSVFWMAPEIVKQTSYTSKADIWSVGCLVVEMLTGTHPWSDLTQMQAIFRIGQANIPAIPSDISPQALDLLNSTFEIDHTKRPTATELLECDFLTARPKTVIISEAQAKASMAAVHAGAQRGMQMMATKG